MTNPFRSLLQNAWNAADNQPTLAIVRGCWSVAVGEELAQHTRPAALTPTHLHVDVRRSWHGELTRRAEQIRLQAQSQMPFDLPPLLFHPSDDFAPATAVVQEQVTIQDDRVAPLPPDTRETALRILWHIRQRSE